MAASDGRAAGQELNEVGRLSQFGRTQERLLLKVRTITPGVKAKESRKEARKARCIERVLQKRERENRNFPASAKAGLMKPSNSSSKRASTPWFERHAVCVVLIWGKVVVSTRGVAPISEMSQRSLGRYPENSNRLQRSLDYGWGA